MQRRDDDNKYNDDVGHDETMQRCGRSRVKINNNNNNNNRLSTTCRYRLSECRQSQSINQSKHILCSAFCRERISVCRQTRLGHVTVRSVTLSRLHSNSASTAATTTAAAVDRLRARIIDRLRAAVVKT